MIARAIRRLYLSGYMLAALRRRDVATALITLGDLRKS